MEALAEVFGLDWKLLVIQLVNFALLLGALSYFLYRPILSLLDERRKMIEKGVTDAEKAEAALKNAETERSHTIGKAVSEATLIVEKAKKDAMVKGNEIIHEAEHRGALALQEATNAAEEEKRKTIKEAEKEIAKMVILGMEKAARGVK